MTALALAGPSSPLRSKAEVRRVINWMPVRIESGSGIGGQQTYLKQCAGLRFIANYGATGFGIFTASGRLFANVDGSVIEIMDDWTSTVRGEVIDGATEFAANQTQVCMVIDSQAFVLDLGMNTVSNLVDNFLGSIGVSTLDNYGVFVRPDTAQFYITANEDFTSIDPLQFSSVVSGQGNLVAGIVNRRQALFLKDGAAEIWYDSGADFPLARDDSAAIEVGCAAAATLRKFGGILYWLGRDEQGLSIVFSMAGYTPQRVSSQALEEALSGLDVSGATAWTYHQEGLGFYVLNVPGLDTTWVYEVSAGLWHERAEWDNGYSQWRAIGHAVAFGKHLVLDALGNLYELTPEVNTNGAGILFRDWISPHNAQPNFAVQTFGSFEVICDTGTGNPASKSLLLSYSNDGGKTWEDWQALPLGVEGDYQARVRATQLGSAKDRVWQFRVTDDVMCNVIAALVNEK